MLTAGLDYVLKKETSQFAGKHSQMLPKVYDFSQSTENSKQ
jgi:hypothetical protein